MVTRSLIDCAADGVPGEPIRPMRFERSIDGGTSKRVAVQTIAGTLRRPAPRSQCCCGSARNVTDVHPSSCYPIACRVTNLALPLSVIGGLAHSTDRRAPR